MRCSSKIFCSLIIFLFCLCWNAEAENLKARKDLLEKYKGSQELYIELQNILFREKNDDRASVNKFYDSLDKICSSSDLKSSEILVDLLDFYIGEAPSEIISNAIVQKGKKVLPFLRKKLIDPVIKSELSDNEKETHQKRNNLISELMEDIYYEIPTYITYAEMTPAQLTKLKLYMIQKCLEKYSRKKDFYPANLDKINEICNSTTNLLVDGWKRPFKYLSGKSFYFLMSLGEDGKENSGDDIYPQIETELHLFP